MRAGRSTPTALAFGGFRRGFWQALRARAARVHLRSFAGAAGGRSRFNRIDRVYTDLETTALEAIAVSAGVVGGLTPPHAARPLSGASCLCSACGMRAGALCQRIDRKAPTLRFRAAGRAEGFQVGHLGRRSRTPIVDQCLSALRLIRDGHVPRATRLVEAVPVLQVVVRAGTLDASRLAGALRAWVDVA